MTYAADFGPFIVETDVDAAVVDTLKRWLPTYLSRARTERTDVPRLAAKTFANTLENEDFLDHHLPAILVTTAQTQGDPEIDGDGAYFTEWRVVVSAVLSARTPPEARALAAIFGGSCRRLLVQHPSLGGFAGGLRWTGGNVAPVRDTSPGGRRNLAAGINQFTVFVDDVLGGEGPREPDADTPYEPSEPGSPDKPYDPLATVTGVSVAIDGVPITRQPGS